MIKSGNEHLEQLRDGRVIYIGEERVDDVTKHPAFKRAAKTVARLYDIKHKPEYKDKLTYEENGNIYSTWFLQAKKSRRFKKKIKSS